MALKGSGHDSVESVKAKTSIGSLGSPMTLKDQRSRATFIQRELLASCCPGQILSSHALMEHTCLEERTDLPPTESEIWKFVCQVNIAFFV